MNLKVMFGPKTIVCGDDQLAAVPMAEKTESYTPIAHMDLIGRVLGKLEKKGIQIEQRMNALWRGGLRMFSVIQVRHPEISHAEMGLTVVVRNSFDKSLPAAIAAGTHCFVCDNGVLMNDVVIGRKHSRFLMEDIDNRIDRALAVLDASWRDHFARVEAYKNRELTVTEAHDLIALAYRKGAIEKVGVADVIDQFHASNHPEFRDHTLWSLSNAFSEIWKGRADLLGARSDALHGLFDTLIGYTPSEVEKILASIDASEVRAAGHKAYANIPTA